MKYTHIHMYIYTCICNQQGREMFQTKAACFVTYSQTPQHIVFYLLLSLSPFIPSPTFSHTLIRREIMQMLSDTKKFSNSSDRGDDSDCDCASDCSNCDRFNVTMKSATATCGCWTEGKGREGSIKCSVFDYSQSSFMWQSDKFD